MLKHAKRRIKLEISEDKITAQGGLGISFAEICSALRLEESIKRHMPKPGSNRGYNAETFILPILAMLNGGGKSIDDLQRLNCDETIKHLLELEMIATPQGTGEWLRRTGKSSQGFQGLGNVSQDIRDQTIKFHGQKNYTLDMDAMEVMAEKREAKLTYKGNLGYMPMLGFLRELPICIAEEFRAGNEVPQSRNTEFLRYAKANMPTVPRITRVCADSAAYQASYINECFKTEYPITFFISADLDRAVKAVIANIAEREWQPFINKKGKETDREIAETIHCMNKTKKSFRLVIQRWKTNKKDVAPGQKTLFKFEDYHYHIVATNSDWIAKEVVYFYNNRGQAENLNKEVKHGFGVNRVPCGQFEANKVWFRLAIMAYNLFIALKYIALPDSWRAKTVKTVRWQLFQIASKLICHSRQWVLKLFSLNRSCLDLLRYIQERCHLFRCQEV